MTGRRIDVSALLNERKFTGFNLRLVLISWLITVFDGFDLMVVSFTAPYIRDEIHLTTAQIATMFSTGLLGTTLGGLIFSPVSDRVGRRPVIVGAAMAFAVLTIGTAFVQTYGQLIVLRFLDGLALGGMVPIAWALNVEFVAKRLRATVITVIMVGYSVGTSGAGPITVWLEPALGWRGLYVVGGVGSLVSALLLFFWLPESLRFLISRDRSPERIAKLVNSLDSAIGATATDTFVLSDEADGRSAGRFRDLFRGSLRLITPLIWLGYMASSVAVYFVNSWGPLILEAMHYPRNTAAIATSFGGIMGSVAGLAIMRVTDRRGSITVLFYPVLLLPVMLTLGLVSMGAVTILALAMLVLMLVGGMHFAFMSIISGLYPTAIRGRGAGWASSMGKFGGVLGPAIGGAILASGLPIVRSYAILALCPLIVIVCAAAITRIRANRATA